MKRIIIGIACIGLVAYAIGAELQSFYKSKFSGINNKVNIRLLQDDESPDMSNFNLDMVGAIKERDLFGQYNSSAGVLGNNAITGLFKYYTTNSKYFLACAGSKVALGSAGAFTTDISPTTNTVTAGSFWSAVTFNNYEYLFNPTVPMMKYDVSLANLFPPVSAPGTNCAYSAVHKNRVWAAKSSTLPYRLYWSSLNNGDDWATTGGYADLPDLTQTITGLISWGGYLYIFTETNIFVLVGSTPNDFSLRKTNSMVGAIAPRSIKVTDVGICFLSRSGVYAFDGNNSTRISDKIDTTISGISRTLIQNACALYDGQKYWLSYTPSGASYNNKVMIYDLMLKDWYLYQGSACNINYFERAYGGTDKGELYGGSSVNDGIVYQLQASTGTESVTHSTETQFLTGTTNNTVVTGLPSVVLPIYDTYTKLLAHFNGANGSTPTPAATGQTLSYAGTSVSTAISDPFGETNGVLSLNGASYTSVLDSNDWNFGTGDFTLEAYVRFTALNNENPIICQRQDGNNYQSLEYNHISNNLFYQSAVGGTVMLKFSTTWVPSINTWYHIEAGRTSTQGYLFVNGTSQTVTLNSGSYAADTGDFSAILEIGARSGGGAFVTGYQDEVRISKGIARHTGSFTPQTYEYYGNLVHPSSGTLTSSNLQINAAGLSCLDKITWLDYNPTNTKLTFQTRTGATNDSVAFTGWQYWSSANTVTLSTVTNSTTNFIGSGTITVQKPIVQQTRNILYYEDEDSASPNTAQFQVSGAVSTNAYATGFLTYTDLSNYDWLTIWHKSPATGNSVEFYMSNDYGDLTNYTTFNTVVPNTWEKSYWYIGDITDSQKSGIRYIRMKYKGDVTGYVYLGEVDAHNYYTSNDVISSTPNDWIQYRAILGTNTYNYTPELYSVTLTYTPALSVSESSLESYYYTKWFDMKTPQLNKQFDSLILEVNASTNNSVTLYCDYDIDFGTKTGTFSMPITSTANTVRLYKNFPSSIYGKSMRLKLYNNDKDATVEVKGCEIRFRQEGATPD